MTTTDNLYREALDVLAACFHYDDKSGCVYEEDYLDFSDFGYQCGASKVAIILDDCVLKTSYSGVAYFDEDDDEPYFTEEFPDYAKMEYELYWAAVEQGIGYFFAETQKADIGIYEQPRVDATVDEYAQGADDLPEGYFENGAPRGFEVPIKDFKGKCFRNLNADEITNYCEDKGLHELYFRIKFDVIRYFLAAYSVDELKKLNQFLIEYDINDIRAGNCGWINGELVIFDFCGFDSSTEKILNK